MHCKLLSILANSSNGVGLVAAKDHLKYGLEAPRFILMLPVPAIDSQRFWIILVFLDVNWILYIGTIDEDGSPILESGLSDLKDTWGLLTFL